MQVLPFLLVGDVNWQSLTVPLAGVAVALVVLGAGFFFVNKRSKAKNAEAPAGKSLVDPFDQGAASERRQSPRRAGQSMKVSIQLINDPTNIFESYVMDRSMGGLRLLVD